MGFLERAIRRGIRDGVSKAVEMPLEKQSNPLSPTYQIRLLRKSIRAPSA